jgi:hypothetical protein
MGTEDPKNKKEYEYKYNNIEQILETKSNIKLIKVYNAHHRNILNQEKLLVTEIIKMIDSS